MRAGGKGMQTGKRGIPRWRQAMIGALAMAAIRTMPAWGQLPSTTTVQKADAWTRVFDGRSGWTGADGIFAIPLSGYEGPDHSAGAKTLFVFSDTFIGEVDPVTHARKNARMINNSLAVLDGSLPDTSKIHFLWGRDDKGGAVSAFIPATPSTAGKADTWYWLQDGFAHKGVVYDLPLIITRNPSGDPGFQFQETGIGLIRIPLGADGEPDLSRATQKDTPLFYKGAKTFYFGCGIFANTAEAGAPDPDDSVYVYGRNSLYVARVQVDEFEDFSKWRYWTGNAWDADISKSASMGVGGAEMSVIAIAQGALKGKYLLTSMAVGPDLYVRVGESPVGPFGNPINIYHAPEGDASASIYTYNAKVHPNLSANGDWLVTYNVNTSDWAQNLADADIYRPRFLRLRFDPSATIRTGMPRWDSPGSILAAGRYGPGYGLDGRWWNGQAPLAAAMRIPAK